MALDVASAVGESEIVRLAREARDASVAGAWTVARERLGALRAAQRALGPLTSYSVPCREALFGAVGEAIERAQAAGELGLVERLLSASTPTRERARHFLNRVPAERLFALRATLPAKPPVVAWLVTDAEEAPPTEAWRTFDEARAALAGLRDVENPHMLAKPPGSPRVLLAVSVFEDAAVVTRLAAPRA